MGIAYVGTAPDYRNRSEWNSLTPVTGGTAGGYILASGVATLVAGVATVTNSNALSTRAILLTYYSVDGTIANVSYGTVVDGVSFKISSTNEDDTNQVAWAILQ